MGSGMRTVASRRAVLGGLAALAALGNGPAAAGIVRRLTLVRPATGEIARDVPFWQDGAPDQRGMAELSWLMRDIEAERVLPIDLRVFYLLAVTQAEFGDRPILVTSGYRTESTNERLRRQGIDADRNSFHLHGRAVDIRIPGVPAVRMAALGLQLGLGGVGIYPTFVHLDTGPPRLWRG